MRAGDAACMVRDMTPSLIALAQLQFTADHPHYRPAVRYEQVSPPDYPAEAVEVRRADAPDDAPPLTVYLVRERGGRIELVNAEEW